MVFDTLPELIRTLMIENFNFLYKLIIISFFLLFSVLIIQNFKPKESKYLMVKQIRTIYYFLSWIMIITIPFHFGYLSPKVSLSTIIRPTLIFYSLNFVVLGIILALNIVKYGTDFITELITDEPKTNGIKNDFIKYFGDKNLTRK